MPEAGIRDLRNASDAEATTTSGSEPPAASAQARGTTSGPGLRTRRLRLVSACGRADSATRVRQSHRCGDGSAISARTPTSRTALVWSKRVSSSSAAAVMSATSEVGMGSVNDLVRVSNGA